MIVDIQLFRQMIKDVMPEDCQEDNEGQLIVYTSVYRWADGSLHDEAEACIHNGGPRGACDQCGAEV